MASKQMRVVIEESTWKRLNAEKRLRLNSKNVGCTNDAIKEALP